MKWKRAIGLGVLLWLLIFVWWSVLMFSGATESMQYILHYILLIPGAILVAWLYYRSSDRVNGFLLGIVMLLAGAILDILITIPFFVGSYADFYLSPLMWIGFLELILVIGLYDLVHKNNLCPFCRVSVKGKISSKRVNVKWKVKRKKKKAKRKAPKKKSKKKAKKKSTKKKASKKKSTKKKTKKKKRR
tara:strand:- start:136 stop:702 length:567 start_codon:yes stop_codon:yes gene_type:complete